MTEKEIRKTIDDRVATLEKRFAERFAEPFLVGGRVNIYAGTNGESFKLEMPEQPCFLTDSGDYFLVTGLYGIKAFGKFGAIVLEYSDPEEGNKLSRFSDGDLFYMEDYSEEEMFQAMLAEIALHSKKV